MESLRGQQLSQSGENWRGTAGGCEWEAQWVVTCLRLRSKTEVCRGTGRETLQSAIFPCLGWPPPPPGHPGMRCELLTYDVSFLPVSPSPTKRTDKEGLPEALGLCCSFLFLSLKVGRKYYFSLSCFLSSPLIVLQKKKKKLLSEWMNELVKPNFTL